MSSLHLRPAIPLCYEVTLHNGSHSKNHSCHLFAILEPSTIRSKRLQSVDMQQACAEGLPVTGAGDRRQSTR